MKHFWLVTCLAAAMMTGCTGMMYGDTAAPVSNRNTVYGKPLPLRATPPQRFSTQHPSGGDQWGKTATAPPENMGHGGGETARIEVAQSSPYQAEWSEPVPLTIEDNEDGWSIRPQAATQGGDGSEETGDDSVTPPGLQPIRPPQSAFSVPEASSATTPALSPQSDEEDQPVAAVTASSEAGAANSGQSAVDTLLKRASAALGKGDLDGAAAYLEDAQRIDNKNPKILYDIANIRYHQGKYRQAEAAASRAVRVGGSNAMMRKTWSLIANSRKALGDNQGAITAAEKAASL